MSAKTKKQKATKSGSVASVVRKIRFDLDSFTCRMASGKALYEEIIGGSENAGDLADAGVVLMERAVSEVHELMKRLDAVTAQLEAAGGAV